MTQEQASERLYQHASDEIAGGPDAHDGAALVLAQPVGHAPDGARPTAGLNQSVEEHERNEGCVRIGDSEDDVDEDGDAQSAQEQRARSILAPTKLLTNCPSM